MSRGMGRARERERAPLWACARRSGYRRAELSPPKKEGSSCVSPAPSYRFAESSINPLIGLTTCKRRGGEFCAAPCFLLRFASPVMRRKRAVPSITLGRALMVRWFRAGL
jgi:hypothetical protein